LSQKKSLSEKYSRSSVKTKTCFGDFLPVFGMKIKRGGSYFGNFQGRTMSSHINEKKLSLRAFDS